MKLIARNFEWFPRTSRGAVVLRPLLKRCSEVHFPFRIGDRNSNQFTNDFDAHLEARLKCCGAGDGELLLPRAVKEKFDFVFAFSQKIVVAEVEKANRDKILYDFLNFHIYLRHGADIPALFLPRNWAHSKGEVDMFDCGKRRYEYCLELGLGNQQIFDRILLVGYDQFTTRGKLLTREIRNDLITKEKQIMQRR